MPAPVNVSRRPRARLVATALGMVVAGAMHVVAIASVVALVYAAVGRAALADGLGLALVGTSIASVWIAWRTSMSGAHASAQSIVVVVVAVAVRDAVSRAAPGSEGATAIAVVVAAGLLIGAATLGVGFVGAARLVRYLPHPVVAGVLAAGGWLLVTSAVVMMSGPIDVPTAAAREALVHWIPGLAIGLALFVATRLLAHPLVVPVGLAVATGSFYLVSMLVGFGPDRLAREGWLFGPLPDGSLLRLPPAGALWAADGSAVLAQAPTLATAAFAAALLVVVFTNALELDHGVDMVPSRELRETGFGNLLGAVFAGMPATIAPTETQLARTMQVRRRSDAAITAMIPLVVLVFGAGLLESIPRPVLGGVLVYLGLKDVGTHLFPGFRRYARADLSIVLLIVATVAVFGLLPGMGVGLAVTVAIFVVGSAGEDVIGSVRTGTSLRSRVTRGAGAREALATHGERTVIYHLEGTVFFGTADKLTVAVGNRLEQAPTPWSIVLNAAAAGTFDATGGVAVVQIARHGERVGAVVYVVGAGPNVRAALTRSGAAVRFEPDLDTALERCEERILHGMGLTDERPSFGDAVARLSGGPTTWTELEPWFEPVNAEAGEILSRQGGDASAFWLLADGRLTAVVERSDGEDVRLESLVPGQVVGELGFVTRAPRAARIVADEPSRLYRMDRDAWKRLDEERPDLALALRDLLLRLASERVQRLSEALSLVRV